MRVYVLSSILAFSAAAIATSAHGEDCKPAAAPCPAPVPLTDYYQGLLAQPVPDAAGTWTSTTYVQDQDAQAPIPFSAQTTATGVSVRTGLSTWNEYNAKVIEKKVEKVKAIAPANVMLPKTPPAKPPAIDVWSKVETQTAPADDSQTLRTTVGADYNVSQRTKFGLSAERADTSVASGAAELPGDQKISAYVAFKAAPLLSVDAKGEWHKSDAQPGATAVQSEKVSVAPKINHTFAVGKGNTLEPYATIKHKIDIGAAASDPIKDSTSNSAGAGVTLATPNSYSVTLSSDIDALGGAEPANINSKLQFKLPLP